MPALVGAIFRKALLLGVHLSRLAIKNRKSAIANRKFAHSHSIVLGGLLEIS
jgi:hypothetical protein